MVERDGEIAGADPLGRLLDRVDRAGRSPQWPFTVGAIYGTYLLLVWAYSRSGLPLSPDARAYVAMSAAISQGDLALSSLVGSDALMYPPLHFPPLYPALISLVSSLPGVDPVLAGALISLVGVLATMLGVSALLSEVYGEGLPGYWRVFLVLSVSLDRLTFRLGRQVLSDSSFFALWIWMLVLLLRYVDHRRRGDLAALCGLAAAACALRYPGAFLAAGVTAALVLVDLRRRVVPVAAGVFGALALAPVGMWYLWASQRTSGGLGHGDDGGTLGLVASAYDSIVGFGAVSLGIQQDRPWGSAGRGGFFFPEPLSALAGPLLATVGLVLVVMAAAVLAGRPVPRLRRGLDPEVLSKLRLVSIPTAVYLVSVFLVRARSGHFVLQRYWGIAVALLWVVLAIHVQRERSGAPSVLTVVLFASTFTTLCALLVGLVT